MSVYHFLQIRCLNIVILSLLGSAAFAGFVVIFVGWAIHIYITRVGIQIQNELSASRDHRMAVLDELAKAIKYIKFFAWEDRWIERVEDSRNREMQWMKKC